MHLPMVGTQFVGTVYILAVSYREVFSVRPSRLCCYFVAFGQVSAGSVKMALLPGVRSQWRNNDSG